jgi:hypothetical protein
MFSPLSTSAVAPKLTQLSTSRRSRGVRRGNADQILVYDGNAKHALATADRRRAYLDALLPRHRIRVPMHALSAPRWNASR